VPTMIKQEDARTCFHCDSNPPSFRVISLENTLNLDRDLEPDCLVALVCQSCLRFQIDDLCKGIAQSNIPIGIEETPDRCLCRHVGFAIVPLKLSERESGLLIDELGTEVLEPAVK
jgi:hypothetical protein